MQSVVNSLAVLAFLGVVLLLFANSALLRIVRDLQAAMTDLRSLPSGAADRGHLEVRAFARDDNRATFAIVVDSACPACHDRSQRFAKHAGDDVTHAFAAVSADQVAGQWFSGTAVTAHVDADLLGHIGVSVTPTLIKYDASGREQWRRVVASDADLERLLREGTQ
jgi:hypothetical protein